VALGSVSPARAQRTGPAADYVVLYRDPHAAAAARAAIYAAGGHLLRENRDIGTAAVRSTNLDFLTAVRRNGAVVGATHERAIGHLPPRQTVERLSADERAAVVRRLHDGTLKLHPPKFKVRADAPGQVKPEPLANRQWDMAMMEATPAGSYSTELGDRRVKVGVIDTGVDATHPDIAANFDAADSRNFVTDNPVTDGPCAQPSCKDPVGVDNNGHGTHIASVIAAPLNGIGIGGVAPNVTLVDVRAGQNSGFFLLQPVIDALTYSGDAGLNVVNLSFYVDPWLYNCPNNPKDDPSAQTEQKTAIAAVQRAVQYARDHNVTVISALGNESADLDHPTDDPKSPDYPPGKAYDRTIDSSCVTVPTETPGVISVSGLGPSGRKAYYSNYSLVYTAFFAPGGDALTPRTPGSTRPRKSSAPIRRRWAVRWVTLTPPATRPPRSSSRTANTASAPITSTCRAPRWLRRTPPALPRMQRATRWLRK
jgi:subtilisin family serine protease